MNWNLFKFWEIDIYYINTLNNYKTFKNHPGVYVLKNITNGMYYIGSTKNLKKRMSQHSNMDPKSCFKIERALKKYNTYSFEVYFLPKMFYKEFEIELIDWVKYVLNINTYNIADSYSNNFVNRTHRKIEYKKVKLFNKITGEFFKEFNSISEASRFLETATSNICKAAKQETKSHAKGYVIVYSKNFKEKKCYKYNRVYKKVPKEVYKKAVEKRFSFHFKPVKSINLQTGVITYYKSLGECSRDTNIAPLSINNNCNGKGRFKHLYKFELISKDEYLLKTK